MSFFISVSQALSQNMASTSSTYRALLGEITNQFDTITQFEHLQKQLTKLKRNFEITRFDDNVKSLQPNDKWMVFPFKVHLSKATREHILEKEISVYLHMEAKGRYMDLEQFVEIIDPSWGAYEYDWIDDLFYQAAFKHLNFASGEKSFAPTAKQIKAAGGLKYEHNEDYKDPGYNACMKSKAYAYYRKIMISPENLYLVFDHEHDKLRWFKIVTLFNESTQTTEYHACRETTDGKSFKPVSDDTKLFLDEQMMPRQFDIFEVKPNPDYLSVEESPPAAKVARTE